MVDEFCAVCPHQRHLKVGDHVADIADEDHRLPLGVGVEGVPHLPLVAVFRVGAVGLHGEGGLLIPGDQAVHLAALMGHDLRLGQIGQEGIGLGISLFLEQLRKPRRVTLGEGA